MCSAVSAPQQPAAVHRSPGAQGRIDRIGILGRPGRQRVGRHSALLAFPQKQHVDDRESYGPTKGMHHLFLAAAA